MKKWKCTFIYRQYEITKSGRKKWKSKFTDDMKFIQKKRNEKEEIKIEMVRKQESKNWYKRRKEYDELYKFQKQYKQNLIVFLII